jgi:hypothetical protein
VQRRKEKDKSSPCRKPLAVAEKKINNSNNSITKFQNIKGISLKGSVVYQKGCK